MRPELAAMLVDPVDGAALTLECTDCLDGSIEEGILRGAAGRAYAVRCGIPRFVGAIDPGQAQTGQAFGFKWKKRESYDSAAAKANALAWYLEKYGFGSLSSWVATYAGHRRILDLGCGSGFSSSLWLASGQWSGSAMWVGVDLSEAIDVARERLGHIPNTHFVQADALALPFAEGAFDLVFSEGVLHHTPSTRVALQAASRVVARGGELHFYVYRRKGPVREFTDDYVREQIAALSDDEAWEALRSLTELGRVLTEAGAVVELKRPVPLLGIPAGRVDVQRLIYWHFAKLYWNPALGFEENVHVNFDWYRPRYAHRQSAEEVRTWCTEANLTIAWFHEEESGFTVRATRQ